MKPLKSPTATPLSLAEQIRVDEPAYIEAAVNAFRKTMKLEYARLRGYAYEAKAEFIILNVSVVCGLDPENRFVKTQSTPAFQPPMQEVNVKIPR